MDEQTRKIIERQNEIIGELRAQLADVKAEKLALEVVLHQIETDWGCEDFEHEDFVH